MRKRIIGLLLSFVLLVCFAGFSACNKVKPDGQEPGGIVTPPDDKDPDKDPDDTQPDDEPEVPLPDSNDDCVFNQTELKIEAGDSGYITFTGTASSYVSGNPEVATVKYIGNSKLKVSALKKGEVRVQGYNKRGKKIPTAACKVTVTQSLKISMPESAESAVDVPYEVTYTSLGQDQTTSMKVDVTGANGIATWEVEDDTVTVHPTAEGKINVKITLSKDSADKGHEEVSASTDITFVNFFQDKYYDYKYFSFERSTESVPEEFAAMPDPTLTQSLKDKIDADRAKNHPVEPAPDPEPAPEPENPDETGGESGAAEIAARAKVRAASDITEGYTVTLSEGVLNGTIPLPESLVIPAYYKGADDSEARPVNKIAANFMRAFAEYSGEAMSEHKEPFVKPFESFTTLNVKSVYIPASVVEIGADAFSEVKIKAVLVQKDNELVTIGRHAFFRTARLGSFNLRDLTKLQTIGSGAFADHCMTEIFIPKSVTVIGKAAFAQIANDANRNNHQTLKSVIFEDDNGEGHEERAVTIYGGTLTNPGDGAFAYNLALQKVRLCNVKRVQSCTFFQGWGIVDVYVDAATCEWAFSPYKYWDKDYQYDPELDVDQNGVSNGAYALIDHTTEWGNPFVYALTSGLVSSLTIDNAMIEDVRALPFAALDYDSRGLLGAYGKTAEGAKSYCFGEVYVLDTLNPSEFFKSRYEQKTDGIQKDGYTRWVLKA